MALIKKPMKAPNEIFPFDYSVIKYSDGQMASMKMDGERMLNLCGEHLLTPALKPVRNQNTYAYAKDFFDYCKSQRYVTDSEIWSPIRSFHMPVKEEGIGSILAAHTRPIPSDFAIYVFDMLTEKEWNAGTEPFYLERYMRYQQELQGFPNIILVPQLLVHSPKEAHDLYDMYIERGEEGLILRSSMARYKHGRCTENEDGMFKFKDFHTADAVIVRLEEQMRLKEGVERTRNAVGELERRYEQDLYEPAGMVGAFIVEQDGVQFKVKPGKGHNHALKTQWWNDYCKYPEKWNGKHCEFKFMPHGTLDKPRIGQLVGFRPDLD